MCTKYGISSFIWFSWLSYLLVQVQDDLREFLAPRVLRHDSVQGGDLVVGKPAFGWGIDGVMGSLSVSSVTATGRGPGVAVLFGTCKITLQTRT